MLFFLCYTFNAVPTLQTRDAKKIKGLIFLKSTQKPLSINVLSIRCYENAKKCLLINPHYVKNTPYFQYKIE